MQDVILVVNRDSDVLSIAAENVKKPEEPDKPEEPEKPEKPEIPEKPEEPQKPEKPEWPQRPGRPHKEKETKPDIPETIEETTTPAPVESTISEDTENERIKTGDDFPYMKNWLLLGISIIGLTGGLAYEVCLRAKKDHKNEE